VSVSPAIAAIALTQTQQFTATVPGGGGAAWAVDGVAGGNTASGQITATGLYTAGTAPGVHIVRATSLANSTQSARASVAVTDLSGVFTYHNDLGRDGANTQEYALTTANVNTAGFGKLTSCPVDGAIYGQPLWAANVTVAGARHNVVYVATQHDSVFAFDADAAPCVQLWKASLVDTLHGANAGETAVPGNLVGQGAGDIAPEVGVTSTPVIDPTTGILYVLAKSIDASQTNFYQRLHALDYTTGAEMTGAPATIAASVPGTASDGNGTTVTFNAQQEGQRPGLALVNGRVYIAWASHEDTLPFHGWLMGYQYANNALAQTAAFNTTPNATEGGIWMGGGAPAADASGNLYVITGNGTFDANVAPNIDYGDSLLQFNVAIGGALSVGEYFTPQDQANDFANDADFGSGGTAVLADLPAGSPVTHLAMGGGKDGTLVVLNRDNFGGYSNNSVVQQIQLGNDIFSTPAFWNDTVYIGTGFINGGGTFGGPVYAYQLNLSTVQFSEASQSAITFTFPSSPSVSANGLQSGIVWVLDNGPYCTNQSPSCGPTVLHAYDATNLATELWNSSQSGTDAAGYPVKFAVPTVANGKVYVGSRGNNMGGADSSTSTPGELDIYALKP
jgi:hypothetical protein